VARIAAFHTALPNPIVANMATLVKHLGGEVALARWLDHFPGRPRILARLFGTIDLLDTYSAQQAVLAALAELRAAHADPPELSGYLTLDTDHETLSGLAWHMEVLFADGRVDEAVRVALAAATLLERLAPRAKELEPTLPDLGAQAGQVRAGVAEAASIPGTTGDPA
jgi:hypothetical protein